MREFDTSPFNFSPGSQQQMVSRHFSSNLLPAQRFSVDHLGGVNVHADALEIVETERRGDEVIIEGGSFDGKNLGFLALNGHPREKLFGIDISPEALVTSHVLFGDNRLGQSLLEKCHLLPGDVEHMPFATNSADIMLALNVLYYPSNIQQALEEFYRVLKPGGLLVVATAGEESKIEGHKLVEAAVEKAGGELGPVYTRNFPGKLAVEMLSGLFEIEEVRELKGPIYLRDPLYGGELAEGYLEEYLDGAVHSYRDDQRMPVPGLPPEQWPIISPRGWQKGVAEGAMPIIEREFIEKGFYEDTAHRFVIACRKPKQ